LYQQNTPFAVLQPFCQAFTFTINQTCNFTTHSINIFMKYSNLLIKALVLLTLSFPLSCKKKENNKPDEEKPPVTPESTLGSITGEVKLPVGSTIKLSDLSVLSAIDDATISNASFTIDTTAKFSTQIITNAAGDVVMMGYNYPGEGDNTIDVNSTALGMIMNFPVIYSLNDDGRLKLIAQLKALPDFQTLTTEISKTLVNNKPAIDPANTSLNNALAEVFNAVSSITAPRKLSGLTSQGNAVASEKEMIRINSSMKLLSIGDNGYACSFAVGVYNKETNVPVKKITVPGITHFAGSISDLYKGIFTEGYAQPFSETFEVVNEGDYLIRARSGNPYPLSAIGVEEFDTALSENVKRSIESIFFAWFGDFVKLEKGCLSQVQLKVLAATVSTAVNIKKSSPEDYDRQCLEGAQAMFESLTSFDDCRIKPKFFQGIAKYFSLTGIITKVAAVGNTGARGFDFLRAPSALDTCYTVINNKIIPCNPALTASITAGNKQTGEPQKQLAKDLEIRVLNYLNLPAQHSRVTWKVTGGGSINAESYVDANGIAKAQWKLGTSGDQTAIASVRRNDGKQVKNAPITFTAKFVSLVEGRWTIDKIQEQDDSEIDVYNNGSYLQFNADSTYTLFFNSEKPRNSPGHYIYDQAANTIVLNESPGGEEEIDSAPFSIIAITTTELVIKQVSSKNGTTIIYLKK
jgi:hypothetical protein